MAETTNKQEGPREAGKEIKKEAEAAKPKEPQKTERVEAGKKLETERKAEEKEKRKKEEKPAAAKKEKEEKKREIVLERVYTVNLRKAYSKPSYKRANTATVMLKEFLSRHMHAGDPAKVKLATELNEFIRQRSSARPPKRIKVQAGKDKEGIVLARLAA